MSIIEAVIYGLIQGLTEFIPVSSSGHLELLTEVFGFSGSFENDVLINIGTLFASIVYFRKRITKIFEEVFRKQNYKTLFNLIISTIPAVIVGFFFIDFFSSEDTRNLNTVIVMLTALGALMILADWLLKKPTKKTIKLPQALTIGLAQVLAFIPGTSRSGSTILTGRATGLNYETAVEYSFLLGIPVVTGAILRVLITDEGTSFIQENTSAFIVGNLIAFLSGMLAIHVMIKFTKKLGLKWFGWYRILLASILLLIVV